MYIMESARSGKCFSGKYFFREKFFWVVKEYQKYAIKFDR